MNNQKYILKTQNIDKIIYYKNHFINKDSKLEIQLSDKIKDAMIFDDVKNAFIIKCQISNGFIFEISPLCISCNCDDSNTKMFYSESNKFYICKNCIKKRD